MVWGWGRSRRQTENEQTNWSRKQLTLVLSTLTTKQGFVRENRCEELGLTWAMRTSEEADLSGQVTACQSWLSFQDIHGKK